MQGEGPPALPVGTYRPRPDAGRHFCRKPRSFGGGPCLQAPRILRGHRRRHGLSHGCTG